MTEICVQVYDNMENIKKCVINSGFHFVEAYTNYDTYYTTLSKKQLKSASYKRVLDNSIIIRNIVGENCDVRNIVYKKKTLDKNGNVVKEIKTKLNIDNISQAKLIFDSLGMICWCDFANQNFMYQKDEIVLDIQHVKGLGNFIEIEEFDSIKGKSDAEKFEILSDIINSLCLPIGFDYSCKKPYMFLKSFAKDE